MVVELMKDEQEEAEYLIRKYYENTKSFASNQYGNLEEYSPLAHLLCQKTFETTKSFTPQFVSTAFEKIDDVVDATDGLVTAAFEKIDDVSDATDGIVTALEKAQCEFPKLVEELKSKLTTVELWALISSVSENVPNSKEELAKFLPSASLEDLKVQERVTQIVGTVLSQPQLLKERVLERLDQNQDGIVSVTDIAGSVVDVSWDVANYCSNLVSSIVGPLPESSVLSETVKSLLDNATVKPIVAGVESSLTEMQAYLSILQPLWDASTILKVYVLDYATNVQEHINPLTPYLTVLISKTSVIDLPLELLQLTTATAGLSDSVDGEKAKMAAETRALLWALMDISFILGAISENSSEPVAEHALEGVTIVKDSEAHV
jgi:hypothetical protein